MTDQQQPPPTAEDMQKMQRVAQAGGTAAANADTPAQAREDARQAMRQARDDTSLELDDATIDKIADTLVGKVVTEFENRGAFDSPPEPVQPPQQPQAPPPPGEAPQGQETPPQTPQKRTWAHKFMGVQ